MTFKEYINFLFKNCEKYEAAMLDFSNEHRNCVRKINKFRHPLRGYNAGLKRRTYYMEMEIFRIRFDDARERLQWAIETILHASKKHFDRAWKRAKKEYEGTPKDFHYICMSIMREQDLLQKRYDAWVKKSGKRMSDYYRELDKK
jgi:hypothetical protein